MLADTNFLLAAFGALDNLKGKLKAAFKNRKEKKAAKAEAAAATPAAAATTTAATEATATETAAAAAPAEAPAPAGELPRLRAPVVVEVKRC